MQDCLYGGTHDFLTTDFAGFGIEYDFIDADVPESWQAKLKPNTKAVYVESMTNPLLGVADLPAVARFAKAHNLVSLIDNTFPSPYNFRPIEIGFDVSLHSCTKYLNGHSDIVGGAVISTGAMVKKITHKLNHLGGSMDPHACFLLHRGMKTLAVRMRQHNESALELAQFLEQHPKVTHVNYPGLDSHPQHGRAQELFDGFSGMLSFELDGGMAAAGHFMQRVEIPIIAHSLGGVETLMTRPAITSHAGMSPEDRAKVGITDGLIRVSVGIEAVNDLIADFGQALA
ncbi:MAG: aminotransferase class I/II-fold pyridoxal phosphate-dependent enzyme [Calditrichaeota bacterium]|nr:aminotransferase class I/II-fold pyridoxal phosphate-dependent enzyme [Calditrichota bacterium]